MYHEFFGLARAPFNNTPDPAFFFAAEEHEEALATMLFGVEQRRGFVLVTGEVGSGKTLLARMLIDRIRSGARIAVIDRPPTDERDLMLAVCAKLGVRTRHEASKADLMSQLERFLVAKHAEGSLNVIVVDEAQTLSHAALEQFRMLGNLETATSKLLQIVLLGQPELQDMLMDPNLTQLRQRLFCARHVGPLTAGQAAAYIAHRVRVAGGQDRALFTDAAVQCIVDASGGLPRLINHICDNCLLMAFSEEQPTVDCAQVEQVVARMMPLQTGRTAAAPTGSMPSPAPHADAPYVNTPPRPAPANEYRDYDRSQEQSLAMRHAVQSVDAAIAEGRRIADTLSTLRRDALEHEETLTSLNASAARSVELLDDRHDTARDLQSEVGKQLRECATQREALTKELKELTEAEGWLRGMITHAQQAGETLDGVIRSGEQTASALTDAVKNARTTNEALIRSNESAGKMNAQIQQSAGQAAFAADDARQMVEQISARQNAVDAALETADGMIRRLGEAVTGAAEIKDTLDAQREQFDARTAHLESLVRRIEGAADRVNEIDHVGDETRRMIQNATETMSHLHDSLAIAERRIDHLTELAGRADQCADTVSKNVEQWQDLSDHVEASHEKLLGAIETMESTIGGAAQQAEIAEAATQRLGKKLDTANTIEKELARRFTQHMETVNACEQKIAALTEETNQLHAERRELARGFVDLAEQIQTLLESPQEAVADANAAEAQLRSTIQSAGKIAQQLGQSSSHIQKQVQTLKQLKASSDRGLGQLLEQSKASADALRQWVLDAEQAHDSAMQGISNDIDETVEKPNGNGFDKTPEPAGANAIRRPNLLPALEAMLNRPSN